MRRFSILIAATGILVAGCDTTDLVDPTSSARSGGFAQESQGSIPHSEETPSSENASGGILIGSGT